MRLRESGMPECGFWESLLDVPLILDRLDLRDIEGDCVELGCGYGTFSVPFAREIRGALRTYDIDPAMVAETRSRLRAAGLHNATVLERDLFDLGFDVDDKSQEVVLLFNILHCEAPERLLREAHRVLAAGGRAAIIHWRSDIETPRGPNLDIRPAPAQIATWAVAAGLEVSEADAVLLPPWHFGMSLKKGAAAGEPFA